MSTTLKEIKTDIKIPYMPVETFDTSKILQKLSEKFGEDSKESNDVKSNLNNSYKNDLSDHVVFILHGMGMEKYENLFKKEQISVDTFLQLNESDLKEIGIVDQKDIEIITKNLKFHLSSKNEFVISENHLEDLKIIKNVSNELLLLQNYCAYLELQMKKHNLTDYTINSEESACMYFKAFAECALKQSQILCSRIYDEHDSDALIHKLLKANKLTLPKALQESLTKKKKKKSIGVKVVIFIGFSSLVLLVGKYLIRKAEFLKRFNLSLLSFKKIAIKSTP